MTLRRDLNTEGCPLVLLGGHIVRDPKNYHETNYLIFEQETKNLKEKMVAGKLAADLVENGDVIFFDCGSSIPFIASQISSEIKFTALCCSLNTFTILKEKSHCEVILAGGIYSNHNSFLHPSIIQKSNQYSRQKLLFRPLASATNLVSVALIMMKQK